MSRLVLPVHTGQRVAPLSRRPRLLHPTERSTSAAHSTVPLARVYGALALGVVCIALSAILTRRRRCPAPSRRSIGWAPLRSCWPRCSCATCGAAMSCVGGASGCWRRRPASFSSWMSPSGIPRSSSRMSPMRRCWRTSRRLSWGWCALLVFHERLRISYWLGLAIALCGMGVIVGHDLFSGSGLGAGDLLAMLAGFFYASICW